jgi:predicted nucleotidyltransferase
MVDESPSTVARAITAHLTRSVPEVEGVCLFGSVARGDDNSESDIDLLVVGRDPELTPSTLLRAFPARLKTRDLSLIYYSLDRLDSLHAQSAAFFSHIQREGKVLYDRNGLLTRFLEQNLDEYRDLGQEVRLELERLEPYSDLRRFNGNFLFVLAQLFAIGRALVILGVAKKGEEEYRRSYAFRRFESLYPQFRSDARVISRLEPFYRIVTKRTDEELPFPYLNSTQEVERALRAVRGIGRGLMKNHAG